MRLVKTEPRRLIDPRESGHLYYLFAQNTFSRSARLVVFHTRRLAERP